MSYTDFNYEYYSLDDLRSKTKEYLKEFLSLSGRFTSDTERLEKAINDNLPNKTEYMNIVKFVIGALEDKSMKVDEIIMEIKERKYNDYLSKLFKESEDEFRKEIIKILTPIQVVEGLFECPRCKSKKTKSTEVQTRSADEPPTYFILCLNCGYRWRRD
jgi:DNA-directed RNA polymerase subunit M/transcription elongation factor TFIIS